MKKEAAVDNDMAFLDNIIRNQVSKETNEVEWFNERFIGWIDLQPESDLIFGDQSVKIDELIQYVNSKETVAEKITVLKENYPGVYLSYCKYYKMNQELNDYIDENMGLRHAGV